METRGIRNNNPGNIRRGQQWQGLSSTQTDSSFDQFVSPLWGIRAIAKIIKTYKSQGIDTISGIITKWAPSNENNTTSYINSVAKYVGISPSSCLDFNSKLLWCSLVSAIIMHENGKQPYSDSLINEAVSMALDS